MYKVCLVLTLFLANHTSYICLFKCSVAPIIPSLSAAGDQFGYSVSISGDGNRLAVSAPYNRGTGQERGRIQVYQVNEDAELIAV